MKSLSIFLCLIISASFNIKLIFASEEIADFDGNEWNQRPDFAKLGFVQGFIAGSNNVIEENYYDGWLISRVYDIRKAMLLRGEILGSKDSLSKRYSQSDCRLAIAAQINGTNQGLTDYAIYEITVGQIVDGLDELYEDYKNRSIKVRDAIYVVKRQIKGASREEVEAILLYLRSDKENYEHLWLKDKDGEIKEVIYFP